MRAAGPPLAVGTACEVLHGREKRRVYAAVQQGEPRGVEEARVALLAQRHWFCVMIVSPGVLWVRARADAWVVEVCEDAARRKRQQPARASSHEDRALRNVATRCGDGDVN